MPVLDFANGPQKENQGVERKRRQESEAPKEAGAQTQDSEEKAQEESLREQVRGETEECEENGQAEDPKKKLWAGCFGVSS